MTDIERFFQYVDKTETCWLWTGTTGGSVPYGQFYVGGKSVRAHRFSYGAFIGQIPPGLLVCHHCDVPLCIRPDHLFAGTMSDNIKDAIKKGRVIPVNSRCLPPWNKGKTHCLRGHEFTEANTIIGRKSGLRSCRICVNRNWTARKAKAQQALEGGAAKHE